jgi:hypothetical protein
MSRNGTITTRTRPDFGGNDLRKSQVFLGFWQMTVRETPSFAKSDALDRNG